MSLIVIVFLASFSHLVVCEEVIKFCEIEIQKKYCDAPYGGDFHTACRYCGIGPQCPKGVTPSGRKILDEDIKREILQRHNIYRHQIKQNESPKLPPSKCLQMLRWDDDLAEVAQVWADQCANVMYGANAGMFPQIFHERGVDRATEYFNGSPGVGQNVAWALTKTTNFTKIIDDLWYRDVGNFSPGYLNEFQVNGQDNNLMTQIIWGSTTHVGCGWIQFPMGERNVRNLYPEGHYENFFVCNYGVGGNIPGKPVYNCDDDEEEEKGEETNGEDTENDLKKETPQLQTFNGIYLEDRLKNSSPEIHNEVAVCLSAMKCVDECTSLDSRCMNEMTHAFLPGTTILPENRVRTLECRIGYILCSLEMEPGPENCLNSFRSCQIGDEEIPKIDFNKIDLKMTSKVHQHHKIDISFYNATERTAMRLATCLEGVRCEDTEACFRVQAHCNEGLDLSNVAYAVRKKLSECTVDDVICHLNLEDVDAQVKDCQFKYEICTDIVIPNDVTISTLPLLGSATIPEASSNISAEDLEPYLFLLGLTSEKDELANRIEPQENLLTNVTNAVLSAIGTVFGQDNRHLELLPLNTSIDALLKDNETLPIYQDIAIIVKNESLSNLNSSSVMNQGFPELNDATVIFSSSNIRIGGDGFPRDPIVDILRDKIRDSLTELATECTEHVCFQGFEEIENLKDKKEETQNDLGEAELKTAMLFSSPGELQLKIAICLQGIRCLREKSCLNAQRKCIGTGNVDRYGPKRRIEISECAVEVHICRMENGAFDERCDRILTSCLRTGGTLLLNQDDPKVVIVTGNDLVKDVTSNITDMIIHSGHLPAVTIFKGSPTKGGQKISVDEDKDGVITLLNSDPETPFMIPNGTTIFEVQGEIENSITDIIQAILQEELKDDEMNNIFHNVSEILHKQQSGNPDSDIRIKPLNIFDQNDDVILEHDRRGGHITIMTSNPQIKFKSPALNSAISTNLNPEKIRQLVEDFFEEGTDQEDQPIVVLRENLISKAAGMIAQMVQKDKNKDGSIRIRPINRDILKDIIVEEKDVETGEEGTNDGERVINLISSKMKFIIPPNSTISFDVNAIPENEMENRLKGMLNFIVKTEEESELRKIAEKIFETAAENDVIRIKTIRDDSQTEVIALTDRDPIEIINSGAKLPENVILLLNVANSDTTEKVRRISEALESVVNFAKVKENDNKNNNGNADKFSFDNGVIDAIREISIKIAEFIEPGKNIVKIKPENTFGNDFIAERLDDGSISIRNGNPNLRFITPENSTLTIDIENIDADDVRRRIEDTLRSILIIQELTSITTAATTTSTLMEMEGLKDLLGDDVIQNLTSVAISELNGTVGGIEILNLDDPSELVKLLADNDTLQFKVDFTVLPTNSSTSTETSEPGPGRNSTEPLVIISHTPVVPLNDPRIPSIDVESLENLPESVRNQFLGTIFNDLAEREQFRNVIDDIIRETNLLNESVDQVTVKLSDNKDEEDETAVTKENNVVLIPRENLKNITLPNTPILIKLNDTSDDKDKGQKIADALLTISNVVKRMKQKRPHIKLADVVSRIVDSIPEGKSLSNVSVILSPKLTDKFEVLDSGHSDVLLFSVPSNYPEIGAILNETVYVNVSPEEEQNLTKRFQIENLLAEKILALTKPLNLQQEVSDDGNENDEKDNVVLNLPMFGISISKFASDSQNKENSVSKEKTESEKILPKPGETSVLSIPEFGFNVSISKVNDEGQFLNMLQDSSAKIRERNENNNNNTSRPEWEAENSENSEKYNNHSLISFNTQADNKSGNHENSDKTALKNEGKDDNEKNSDSSSSSLTTEGTLDKLLSGNKNANNNIDSNNGKRPFFQGDESSSNNDNKDLNANEENHINSSTRTSSEEHNFKTENEDIKVGSKNDEDDFLQNDALDGNGSNKKNNGSPSIIVNEAATTAYDESLQNENNKKPTQEASSTTENSSPKENVDSFNFGLTDDDGLITQSEKKNELNVVSHVRNTSNGDIKNNGSTAFSSNFQNNESLPNGGNENPPETLTEDDVPIYDEGFTHENTDNEEQMNSNIENEMNFEKFPSDNITSSVNEENKRPNKNTNEDVNTGFEGTFTNDKGQEGGNHSQDKEKHSPQIVTTPSFIQSVDSTNAVKILDGENFTENASSQESLTNEEEEEVVVVVAAQKTPHETDVQSKKEEKVNAHIKGNDGVSQPGVEKKYSGENEFGDLNSQSSIIQGNQNFDEKEDESYNNKKNNNDNIIEPIIQIHEGTTPTTVDDGDDLHKVVEDGENSVGLMQNDPLTQIETTEPSLLIKNDEEKNGLGNEEISHMTMNNDGSSSTEVQANLSTPSKTMTTESQLLLQNELNSKPNQEISGNVQNSQTGIKNDEGSSTTAASTPIDGQNSDILDQTRNVLLGILSLLMTQNLALPLSTSNRKQGRPSLSSSSYIPTAVKDPTIRKKIEESQIILDQNNINFTIPVRGPSSSSFDLGRIKEYLQQTIKDAFGPNEVADVKISVEERPGGELSVNANSPGLMEGEGGMDLKKFIPTWVLEDTDRSDSLRPDNHGFGHERPEFVQSKPILKNTDDIQGYFTRPGVSRPTTSENQGFGPSRPILRNPDGVQGSFPDTRTEENQGSGQSSSILDYSDNIEGSLVRPAGFKPAKGQNQGFGQLTPVSENQDDIQDSLDLGVSVPVVRENQGPEVSNTPQRFRPILVENLNGRRPGFEDVPEELLRYPVTVDDKLQGSESRPEVGNERPGLGINYAPGFEESRPILIYYKNQESESSDPNLTNTFRRPGFGVSGSGIEHEGQWDIETANGNDHVFLLNNHSSARANDSIPAKDVTDQDVIATFSSEKPENGSNLLTIPSENGSKDENIQVTLSEVSSTITANNKVKQSSTSPPLSIFDIKEITSESTPSKVTFLPKIITSTATSNFRKNDKVLLDYFPTSSLPSPRSQDNLDVFIDDDNKILDYVSEEENKAFDRRLNVLEEESSSAVQATVVEDLNYARSIRNSRGLGIATITSITIGVLGLFAFALLIFMAVARRRRRYRKGEAGIIPGGIGRTLYGAATPSQSRTTFTDSPLGTAETPSLSGPSFMEEALIPQSPPSPPLSPPDLIMPDPVVPIDGHQTIISSYNEFITNNEQSKPPSPPILKTKNLNDSTEYLFARHQN